MNAGSLDVFHNSRNKNVLSVADSVDFKLNSHHILVNQHRIFYSLCKNDFHIFFYVIVVECNNHILSAKNVAWSEQYWIAQFCRCLKCFLFGEYRKSFRAVDVKLFAQFFKTFAVFCKVD